MLYKSQNGWPASSDRSVVNIKTFDIPVREGVVRVPLRVEAAPKLIEMIQWWDANIEPVYLSGKGAGTWGYAFRNIRGSTTTLSNHASGTAIDINAPLHPLGKRDTLPPDKANALRAKIRELGLRWGGDFRRPDDMHFELNFPPPADVVAYSQQKAAGQTVVEKASEAVAVATEAGTSAARIVTRKGLRKVQRNWLIVGVSLASIIAIASGVALAKQRRRALPSLPAPTRNPEAALAPVMPAAPARRRSALPFIGLGVALLLGTGATVWFMRGKRKRREKFDADEDDKPQFTPSAVAESPAIAARSESRRRGSRVTTWKGMLGKERKGGLNFHRLADSRNNYRGGLNPKHTVHSAQLFADMRRDYGIQRIVTLNADKDGDKLPALVRAAGLESIYIPSGEKSLPSRSEFERIKAALRAGNTLVHCAAGADRTGAVVARYYVEEGIMPVAAAVEDMKRYKSGNPYDTVMDYVVNGPRK